MANGLKDSSLLRLAKAREESFQCSPDSSDLIIILILKMVLIG